MKRWIFISHFCTYFKYKYTKTFFFVFFQFSFYHLSTFPFHVGEERSSHIGTDGDSSDRMRWQEEYISFLKVQIPNIRPTFKLWKKSKIKHKERETIRQKASHAYGLLNPAEWSQTSHYFSDPRGETPPMSWVLYMSKALANIPCSLFPLMLLPHLTSYTSALAHSLGQNKSLKIDPLPSQINSQVVEDFYWMYHFPKVHLFLILLFMGCIFIELKFKILYIYMLNWHFKVLFHLKYFWSIRMYYL